MIGHAYAQNGRRKKALNKGLSKVKIVGWVRAMTLTVLNQLCLILFSVSRAPRSMPSAITC